MKKWQKLEGKIYICGLRQIYSLICYISKASIRVVIEERLIVHRTIDLHVETKSFFLFFFFHFFFPMFFGLSCYDYSHLARSALWCLVLQCHILLFLVNLLLTFPWSLILFVGWTEEKQTSLRGEWVITRRHPLCLAFKMVVKIMSSRLMRTSKIIYFHSPWVLHGC